MNARTVRHPLLRRLSKYLFVTVGVLAILLALGLGLFRLLIGQIPEYQTELKAWVADELGWQVDFANLNARLGFSGPELSLRAASIGSGERGDFLQADEATLTLDSIALIFGRRVEISRLTLGGVRLTIERDAAGTFRLGDHAIEAGDGAFTDLFPEAVEVVIRDSALHYIDAGREQSWDFNELEVVVASTVDALTATATLRPPENLAEQLEVSVIAGLAEDGAAGIDWHFTAAAEALDLAALAQILPLDMNQSPGGRGDIEVGIDWVNGELAAAQAMVGLDNLIIDAAQSSPPYERFAVTANWQRAGANAWQLDLTDLSVRRNGQGWANAISAGFGLTEDADGISEVHLSGDFIRLEDLAPIILAFPETQLADQWILFEPEGDIRDLSFALQRRNDTFAYALDAVFEQFGVNRAGQTPGLNGISGRVQASEDSGTIEFASGALLVDWPALFPVSVNADSLTGAVVWRQGRNVVQILSVDLGLGILGNVARASFDLRLPRDGRSPTLDLEAELAELDVVPAKSFLPTPILPDPVVAWLDRAIVGGSARDVALSFFGPVRSFPFDDGSGQFRVAADIENVALDYMNDWPLAAGLDGHIEFVNAGFAATAAGSTLSNRSNNVVVTIPNLRQPVLELSADTEGPLTGVVDYLRGAPLIAEHLGPDFDRIEVLGGAGAMRVALGLPLTNLAAYTLDASLSVVDGELAIAGLAPAISEINGMLTADEEAVAASGLNAIFLGGPVTVALSPSQQDGYRAELAVEGETTAEAVAESFSLPHENLLAGQTLWRGRLLLPALDLLATAPTRVTLESNLAGVAIRFPEPLAKPPSTPTNLLVNLEFAAGNRLEVAGNLGATRRFLLNFATTDEGLRFERGAIRFGGGEPVAPIQNGILVDGQLAAVDIDQWIALAGSSDLSQAGPLFLGADVEVADFYAFGQQLGETSLRVQQGATDWLIDLDSEAIAGSIVVPRSATSREAIRADMSRVYLASAEGGDLVAVDPRELPGLRFAAGEFGIGPRRLGRVAALVEPDPRGLLLTQFSSETESFSTELTGSWLQGALGTRTTIDARIQSTDVQTALAELGLDPVISGETAEVTASVFWDSAPGGDWLDHLNGQVSLFVETGTLREIDPGAGRVVGLMSIAALPRRLLLDFRDVFEEGFAFDEISGDFRVTDGNAYTDNLKFGGPAAEIGVVGRTGLRDRDYRQQIVVTSEPGKVLPTVAGLLAGAGVGAAMFVFTRLFKEPLKGIGRASYCLQGSWEAPIVEPIDKDAPEQAASCAELPEDMLAESIDE